MGDVVNLRMKRKEKARTEKERAAEGNRRLHGRSRAEREAERLGKALEEGRLEGHRLTPSEET